MNGHIKNLLLLGLLGAAGNIQAQGSKLTTDQIEFFEKKIRPVLVESCYKCHSTEPDAKIKGGLALDTKEGLLRGGDSGPAVVPGNPAKSPLIKAIHQVDKETAMPPAGKGEKLSESQIAAFEEWVKNGAPDPRSGNLLAKSVKMDIGKVRSEHWAFKTIANPPTPKVNDAKGWGKSPLDSFVLAKLQEKKLQPSALADKHTLIRRVTFDLIGLPPTPEEVDAFLKDNSKDAFAKVVDRLLASPHYGERWGRHWLDVARYADTSGDRQNGRNIVLYPYAWTYRDYVIDAFNSDLPYDQFIIQQIAADRLPETAQQKKNLAALGFLTVGKQFMKNKEELIDDRIDVVTKGLMGLTASCARCHDHKFDPIPTADYYSLHGVFNSSLEHREGPEIAGPRSEADHQEYLKKVAAVEEELKAFKAGEEHRLIGGMLDRSGEYMLLFHENNATKVRNDNRRKVARDRKLDSFIYELWDDTLRSVAKKHDPLFSPWNQFAALPEKDFAKEAKPLAAKIAANNDPAKPYNRVIAKAFAAKAPASLKEVAAVYTKVLGDLQKAVKAPVFDYRAKPSRAKSSGFDPLAPLADPGMESIRLAFFGDNACVDLTENQMGKILGVQFRNSQGSIENKIVILNGTHPGSPVRAMSVEDSPRPKNSPIFIRGEPRNPSKQTVPRQFIEVLAPNRTPFTEGSGRLELAKAIASRDNPLTARVFVNRVWQHHFGQPIVRTPSDFGVRADAPTHPEMLDHLASYFMDHGWSVKKLHRYILLSSVYQQDSKSNAKGMQEDPTNQWLWRMNIQRLDFEEIRDSLLSYSGKLDLAMGGQPVNVGESTGKRDKYASAGSDAGVVNPYRRTVYAKVDRAGLPAMFSTFDFANPDMSAGERYLTTVPQQALFMMNSPFVIEQAKHIVSRKEFGGQASNEAKIQFLYRTLYQRAPLPAESKMAMDFLAKLPAGTKPVAEAGSVIQLKQPDLSKMSKSERKAYLAKKGGSGSTEPMHSLDNWERFAQVLLLSNELIFVN